MKVILTSDVKGLGKKFDAVEVTEGYARNYLLPKNMATIADTKSVLEAKTKKEAIKFKQDISRKDAEDQKKKIEQAEIEFRLKTHESGKLFGSVTAKEISEELKKKSGIDIDKKRIQINDLIKTPGIYTAHIKLYEGVVGNLKVRVIEE